MDPEDRYYNPEPQYTHSLINLGSHTPETPEGVGGLKLCFVIVFFAMLWMYTKMARQLMKSDSRYHFQDP